MARALEGLMIVDLGHVLAAPFCTMILADMGANVIKIEPPIGDDSRAFGPFIDETDASGKKQSGYFFSINRNKRSICINLKTEAGKTILRELISKADVVVENFRPDTMGKLGFGFEEMRAINPAVIYCSISGFGHDALPEYASKPAYDMVAQAYSGLMSITGPLGGPPVRVGASIGDIMAGHQGAIGILAALEYRHKTGKGQHVDISMVDGLVYTLENAIVRYTIDKEIPVPLGSAHPTITPFQGFEAKDGQFVVIAIGNDVLWSKFCKLLGRDDLIEHELYKTNGLRTKNRDELVNILAKEMRKRTADEWIEALDAVGLPNSPINTIDKVVSDKNLHHRNMIVTVDQPKVGPVTMAGSPFHLSETPGDVYMPAPMLGQHTREVLSEVLGYDNDKIQSLISNDVVIANDWHS
jgi:CoA:oxalate CoA-transferase